MADLIIDRIADADAGRVGIPLSAAVVRRRRPARSRRAGDRKLVARQVEDRAAGAAERGDHPACDVAHIWMKRRAVARLPTVTVSLVRTVLTRASTADQFAGRGP